jgi:hypothetical protein
VRVGEITFATTRYPDFFTKLFRMVNEHNLSAAFSRCYSTHRSCRARANNYCVIAEIKHTVKVKLKLFYKARLSTKNLQSITSLASGDYFAGLFYDLT